MGDIHAKVKALSDKKDRKNMDKIEGIIGKHCKNKGKKLTRKEEKVCYYIDPIKRELSRPLSMGADPKRLCQKLERKSAEICTVKFKIKTKTEGAEPVNYKKMRVKHLRQILRERGVRCQGCTEKSEFVKKCKETEHLEEM